MSLVSLTGASKRFMLRIIYNLLKRSFFGGADMFRQHNTSCDHITRQIRSLAMLHDVIANEKSIFDQDKMATIHFVELCLY